VEAGASKLLIAARLLGGVVEFVAVDVRVADEALTLATDDDRVSSDEEVVAVVGVDISQPGKLQQSTKKMSNNEKRKIENKKPAIVGDQRTQTKEITKI
jgi:hypothetical protein